MWYSYDYGLAHFISVNTETDFKGAGEEHHGDSGVIPAGGFGTDGEYLAWLEADLAKANASRNLRPWIFAGGHKPLYSAGGTGGSLNTAIEAMFHKYKVDVYFAGHLHSYARSLPVYDKQPDTTQQDKSHYINPAYTSHVLVGGAGCDEMDPRAQFSADANCSGSSGQIEGCELSNSFPPVPVQPKLSEKSSTGAAWNVYDDAQFGTGVLTVFNATTMQWRYIHSEDMSVADEFYITK